MPPPVPRSPVFGIEALANGPHRLGCIEREAQKAREVAEELGDERVLVPPGCVLHDRHTQEAGEFSDEMPGVLISESEMPEMAQPKIRAVFEAEPDVEPILPRLAVYRKDTHRSKIKLGRRRRRRTDFSKTNYRRFSRMPAPG